MADKYLKPTNMESLPNDAIFNILLRLPAQDIYEAARFVCPKWFRLTRTHDFARAHLNHSTHGLLIQDICRPEHERPILVGARSNGRIDISNFEHYKFKGIAMSSCNGLILETDDDRLCITNPATKQHFALPTNKTQTQIPAIAYAAATNEYKVVCAVYNNYIHSDSQPDGIEILTVGVDMDWTRRVDIQHLSLEDKGLLRHRPLATQGFVHWATAKGTEWGMNGEAEEEYVLTLNVEKEAITRSHIPPCLRRREGEERLLYYYLSTGSRLSVLVGGRTAGLSWEVWVMESETGEWREVTRVDLEAQKCVVLEGIMPVPVGCSKFGKVLVFSSKFVLLARMHTGFMFAYNVCTHEIESFELGSGSKNFVDHRNSLVWLN